MAKVMISVGCGFLWAVPTVLVGKWLGMPVDAWSFWLFMFFALVWSGVTDTIADAARKSIR